MRVVLELPNGLGSLILSCEYSQSTFATNLYFQMSVSMVATDNINISKSKIVSAQI